MDELNPTAREQEIYEEMELTPEMIRSIRTLCGTCLRHFVDAKTFKIALVPSADRSILSSSTIRCKTLSSIPSTSKISISMSWIVAFRQTPSFIITPTSANACSMLFRSA